MTTTRDRERLDADAMKTQRMDNSVAPVTGASEGGGKVVARQLAAAGVTVYVGSRDARRGQAAVGPIQRTPGGGAPGCAADGGIGDRRRPGPADRRRPAAPGQGERNGEPITAEKALNDCCLNLLTTIGLEAMHPERAAQLRADVSASRERYVPAAARHAIMSVLR